MTIDEAILELRVLYKHYYERNYPLKANACKLGIEALKFFKDLEDRGALPPDARLPGETTD